MMSAEKSGDRTRSTKHFYYFFDSDSNQINLERDANNRIIGINSHAGAPEHCGLQAYRSVNLAEECLIEAAARKVTLSVHGSEVMRVAHQ
jgi:hypothetical protein